MKTIGMIGGASWVSTAHYYAHLNRKVNARLRGSHSAKVVLVSIDFGEIVANNDRDDHDANYLVIRCAAEKLKAASVDFVLLGANTMHMYADRLRDELGIDALHIADAAAAEARRLGLSKVGLLGTRFVMDMDFYRSRLEKAGLEVLTPGEASRRYVNDAIFQELTKDVFREETRARFQEIVCELVDQGCDGVLLACTEIPILLEGVSSPVPLLDTLEIHAEAAVKRALD